MSSDTCRTKRYWTEEEDEILHREASWQLGSLGAIKDWNHIASKLPGRTNKDCRKRWTKVSANVNKGPWSPEENDRLRDGVEQYGYSWTLVAQTVETRHADQCAKRWYHFLDPSLTHEQWDERQDEKLLAAVSSQGRSWKVISETEFPYRSPTDLKNRYIIIQRRLKQNETRKPKPGAAAPTAPTAPTKHEPISEEFIPGSAGKEKNLRAVSIEEDNNSNIIPDDDVAHDDMMFLDSLAGQQSTTDGISADTDFSEFLLDSLHDPVLVEEQPEINLPATSTSDGVDMNDLLALDLTSVLPGSGEPDIGRQEDAAVKFTLELEGLETETLNRIMSVVLTSQEHLNMKFVRSHNV